MNGIVLARRDFRESDQIISILTAEAGKQDYIARGVKKITSKNAAHLEPCSLISFGSVAGKELAYLTNVQSVQFFSQIRQSLKKMHLASYTTDALNRVLQQNTHERDMYYLFFSWLEFLERIDDEHVRLLLLDAFLIKLFSLLGFHPILEECVVCDKTFKEIGAVQINSGGAKKPRFYFAGGGIVCHEDAQKKKKIGEQLLQCGLQEMSSMSFLLRSDWKDILLYTIETAEYQHLHTLIFEFVLYHSEQKWEDWKKFLLK